MKLTPGSFPGVIAPVLDLATRPGGGVVSQVRCGETLRVLGAEKSGFVEVAAAWGAGEERGWVKAAGLGPPAVADRWVTSVEALAYAEPTRRAGPPVERLPLGAGLPPADSADRRRNGFTAVTVRGATLFVQDEDLGPAPPSAASAAARLAVATSLLGRPYVWGGCSSLGMDCSGLVKLLGSLCGVGLPHSAAAQAVHGAAGFRAVAGLDASRSGDCIYLRPDEPGSRVDHVVVRAGKAGVIHASAEGGRPAVRRERWADVRHRGVVASVRRLIEPAEAVDRKA